MIDLMKRDLAPLTKKAWDEIDAQAVRTLKGHLSARAVVDVSGPHGLELASVNQGRVAAADKEAAPGVQWGLRESLPLIEIRVPFSLNVWELDNLERGSLNPDIDPLLKAAERAAIFEDSAVYKGFAEGGIKGLIEASSHKPVKLALEAESFVESTAHARIALERAGIGGPYTLVLGSAPFHALMAANPLGFSPLKRIIDIIGGNVKWSGGLDGGVLLSMRGGDFQFTLGQDLAIGYTSHDHENVHLYITESFTFRVLEPAATVAMEVK